MLGLFFMFQPKDSNTIQPTFYQEQQLPVA